MTTREKQKEFLVTVRSIIANENQIREVDEICSMAKHIIDMMDDYYPEEEKIEYNTSHPNYNELAQIIGGKETTRTCMHKMICQYGYSSNDAWNLINDSIELGILVKGEKLKYKLAGPF